MGGLICAIPRQAILRFDSVPTKVREEREFDEQIRELFANPVIATAVGTELQAEAVEVCEILSHDRFSHADRLRLYEVVEKLYEDQEP